MTRDFGIGLALLAGALLVFLRLPAIPPDGAVPPFAASIVIQAGDAALLLAAAGALSLAFARRNAAASPAISQKFRVAVSLAAAGFALLLLKDRAGATKTTLLPWPGGDRHFWLDDDMMISMRHALHFARGEGLVWNPGEAPVEGYSNFLWTLLMALPHLAGLPLRLAPGFVLAVNAILLAAMVLLWTRAAGAVRARPLPLILGLIFLTANRWTIYWAAGGSEGIALALALLALHFTLERASPARPAGIAAGAIAGMLPLLRADALALLAAFLPAAALQARRGRLRPFFWIAAFAPVLIHFLFRRSYYGDWLPNTYYLKVEDAPLKAAMGVHYLAPFLTAWAPWLGLHALHAYLRPGSIAGPLALVPWAGIAYAAFIGGDELPENRFLVPLLPLILLGAVRALSRLEPIPERRNGRRSPGRAWMILLMIPPASASLCLPGALRNLGMERLRHERQNVILGLTLRANTDPGARIAHYWAGAAPYFSERPAIDLLGKVDRRIARLPARPWEWQPGHNKHDADYSLSLRPDVIVTALPADRLDAAFRSTDPHRAEYPGLYGLYGHPGFLRDYAPNLVPLPLSREFHAVLVRSGSPAARPPGEWREPWEPGRN